ncbi:hypothetical protein BDR05DRAFT_965018 [Suillus weaverae]|nr:hypothetical protein BDR05DRAFT_965018 [Suillus weaverae]
MAHPRPTTISTLFQISISCVHHNGPTATDRVEDANRLMLTTRNLNEVGYVPVKGYKVKQYEDDLMIDDSS